MLHDPERGGEAVRLVQATTEAISGFNFLLERDLRRRRLIARMIIFLNEEPTLYTPESWTLRVVEQGLAVLDDLTRIPLDDQHAKHICDALASVNVRTDNYDERDLRIKELKERVKFLEAVVFKSLGMSKADLRMIRED